MYYLYAVIFVYVCWIVYSNVEYHRYVKKLTPDELREFKEEENIQMQGW